MSTVVNAPTSAKKRNPLLRALFFLLGMLSLLGLAFSWLPLIPTFDLVLLAAFFFSMSSDRMYNWMLNHRVFGRIIKGYRDYGLTTKAKWRAVIGLVLSLTLSAVFLTEETVVRVILAAVGAYGVWFVFSRPTRDPATLG
ncbi:MAG: YbaN family protein [Acidimicrobiia bacterium]|nr:YbaN family protein [Acidimicrobiia bacterium]